MKRIFFIVITVLMFACNSENANDCFQTSGTIVQRQVDIANFERILVNRGVELILKQDDAFSVIIETGENLINDVSARIEGNQLVLSDGNTCNFVRDYASTKVYVSAPNIIEIRSSTQYDVSSDGVLNYESLSLFSEDFFASGTYTMGDFRLQVDLNELKILTNNLSSQYISGNVETLDINFASGAGRFDGAELIANRVVIQHRGSNDMIVNPQDFLGGIIRGTGDVISINRPDEVDVEVLYNGQLIFQEN